MNRWSRIVLGAAAVGIAGWIAAGLQGRAVAEAGRHPSALALHTQLGFVSTLALLLADLWIVIFLGLAARALGRIEPGSGAASGAASDARRTGWLGAATLALVVLQPALSSALYPNRLRADIHFAIGLVALAAELFFLFVAVRALGRQGRRFAVPGSAPPPPI